MWGGLLGVYRMWLLINVFVCVCVYVGGFAECGSGCVCFRGRACVYRFHVCVFVLIQTGIHRNKMLKRVIYFISILRKLKPFFHFFFIFL